MATMDRKCPRVFAVMMELPPQPSPLCNCSPQTPAHASHACDHATQHPSQVLEGEDHSESPRRVLPTPVEVWRGPQHTCAENMPLSLLVSTTWRSKRETTIGKCRKT